MSPLRKLKFQRRVPGNRILARRILANSNNYNLSMLWSGKCGLCGLCQNLYRIEIQMSTLQQHIFKMPKTQILFVIAALSIAKSMQVELIISIPNNYLKTFQQHCTKFTMRLLYIFSNTVASFQRPKLRSSNVECELKATRIFTLNKHQMWSNFFSLQMLEPNRHSGPVWYEASVENNFYHRTSFAENENSCLK